MNKKDNFDKFIDTLFKWEDENPRMFNLIGHIILILCAIGNLFAFIYALTK